MAGENKPIDIGVFNQLNSPQLSPEEHLISHISRINWSSIPFSTLEVVLREEGKACTVRMTKTCKVDSEGNIT